MRMKLSSSYRTVSNLVNYNEYLIYMPRDCYLRGGNIFLFFSHFHGDQLNFYITTTEINGLHENGCKYFKWIPLAVDSVDIGWNEFRFVLRIREVYISNLAQHTYYADCGFFWYS